MQRQPATILSVRIATSPAPAGDESFEKYARRTQRLANQWVAIAESHGGEVIVIRPDALRILFGAPVPVEDDAVRAVRAALEIRALLATSADSSQVCAIAVTSGDIAIATLTATPRWDAGMESSTRHGSTASETLYLGSLFVEADNLMRQTQPGQVLLNERAQQLAQGRFPFILRLAEDERGTVLCYEVAAAGDSGLLTPVPSAPSSLPAGTDDQLLGRTRELDLLSAWWPAAAQGRGQVVGIVGEAGVGKTRLLREFRQTLNPDGVTWIDLTCLSTDRDTPYSLAAQLLRSIFGILPGDDAEAAAAKIEKRLAELSGAPGAANPEINLILRETLGISTSHVAEDERKARRGRLVNVLRAMMASAAQQQPLIIAIDDLHWVDEASFELLSQVTDGIHRLGVQIVVLYRPEFQHNWFDKTYYRHLTLDQLDQGAAYDLLRALLHSEELPRGLGVLLQKTGGNPFFIQEMVKSLQESGILVQRAVAEARDPDAIHGSARWELRAPLTEQQLPGTVERTLRVRLASLTAPTLAVLEPAAVIGPQFGLPLLRLLLPDTSSHDLDAALAELEQRGFVEASWEVREYRFRHALILDAVGQIMPPSQHQSWHRRIAEVLEKQGGDIDRLAHHLFSSLLASRPAEPPKVDRESDPAQVEKAIACLLECGERSLLRNAARAAITYFQRVLLLSPFLPDRYAADVLSREGIGDALTLLGDFDAAGTELRIAYGALHMRPLGPAERRRAADLTRRIGRVCGWRGEHGLGLEWMAEGLRGLGEAQNDADRAVAALLYVHKGSVEYNRGNLDEVASDCARGLQLAQQVGQLLPAEAEAHNMLGIIAWAQGRIHEALAQYELSRTAWQALGNSYQVARVDGNMGVAYFYLAEWEQARVYHTRCKEYWEQVEDRDMLAHPCLNLGNIYLYQGNWEQAAIHFSRALALWSSAHHERFMSLGHTNLGLLAIEQEEWAKAQAQLEESYTILVGANIRDLLREVLSALAGVAIGMRSLPRAEELGVKARQSGAERKMQHEEALALRVLGRIHLAHAEQEDRSAGEFECARADLQGALAIFEEMANRYEVARTRYHLARVEFAAGHPKAAANVLEVALATFAALGANHDHKLAEQLSGKLSQQL
ncbi:MAG: AAA family ATPase [Anaerolineales bacterium]|nr:AAA family ATPase [Anaerolineales bacterium]